MCVDQMSIALMVLGQKAREPEKIFKTGNTRSLLLLPEELLLVEVLLESLLDDPGVVVNLPLPGGKVMKQFY